MKIHSAVTRLSKNLRFLTFDFCVRKRTSLRISLVTDLACDFDFMTHKLHSAFTVIRFWHRPHIHSQWSSHERDKHLNESIIEWRSGLTPKKDSISSLHSNFTIIINQNYASVNQRISKNIESDSPVGWHMIECDFKWIFYSSIDLSLVSLM